MLPDFLHLYLVAFICGLNLIMIWVIILGPREEMISTFYGAFVTFLYMITAGVDEAYPYAKGLIRGQGEFFLDQMVIVIAHALATFLFIWFIKAMIITIIMWPFTILVHQARKASTVPQDLSRFFKWAYQGQVDRKNSNSHFLKLIDRLLKEKNSEFKQAMVRIVAARALKKAFSQDSSHPGLSNPQLVLNRIKLHQNKARTSIDGNLSTIHVGEMSIRFSHPQHRSSSQASHAAGSPRILVKTLTKRTSNTLAAKLASEVTGLHMMDVALAPLEAARRGMRVLDGRHLDLVSAVKSNLFSRLGSTGSIPTTLSRGLPHSLPRPSLPGKMKSESAMSRLRKASEEGNSVVRLVSRLQAAHAVRFSESALEPQNPITILTPHEIHNPLLRITSEAALLNRPSNDLRVRKESSHGMSIATLERSGSDPNRGRMRMTPSMITIPRLGKEIAIIEDDEVRPR